MNTPSRKVVVIGDGAWGTALAIVLRKTGHRVTVWGAFPGYVDEVRSSRENRQFLPGVTIPPDIGWTSDRADAAAGADLAVVAVPTRYCRAVLASFAGLIDPAADVVSVAKGLDPETRRRMSEVARDVLGLSRVAALSGPSHAEEVARDIPTAVVLACSDPARLDALRRRFAHPRFRVYTSEDVAGVELGGALKNVVAVAVGVSDGLGFGDNTRAALITRGLAEITRLGCALGARPSTFSGLSGMGDLIVTCTSRWSRNRAVGERLGRGESIEQILADMKQAAEGVWNCAAALALAREHGIDVPIAEQVHAIVHEGRNPHEAVEALLTREFRPEAR